MSELEFRSVLNIWTEEHKNASKWFRLLYIFILSLCSADSIPLCHQLTHSKDFFHVFSLFYSIEWKTLKRRLSLSKCLFSGLLKPVQSCQPLKFDSFWVLATTMQETPKQYDFLLFFFLAKAAVRPNANKFHQASKPDDQKEKDVGYKRCSFIYFHFTPTLPN